MRLQQLVKTNKYSTVFYVNCFTTAEVTNWSFLVKNRYFIGYFSKKVCEICDVRIYVRYNSREV